jgi:putative zinc finger/helix-turn-helix YgiT family protein
MASKPFPWMCGECGRNEVRPKAIEYKTEIKHDGKLYEVHVPSLEVPTCSHCHEQWFDAETDDQINIALRQQIGLLQPEEIRRQRKALRLTQKDLAEKIGAAESSLSRWENGSSIQSKSTDKSLRMFFKHPNDPVWDGSGDTETANSSTVDNDQAVRFWDSYAWSHLCLAATPKLSYPWRVGGHHVSLGDAVSVFALHHDDADVKQLTIRIASLAKSKLKQRNEAALEKKLRGFEQLREILAEATHYWPAAATRPVSSVRFYGGGQAYLDSSLEESLLGRLLLRPIELDAVSRLLKTVDFRSVYCRHVYEVMLNCFQEHSSLDAEHLLRCVKQELNQVEPRRTDFLAYLADQVRGPEPAIDIAMMLRNRTLVAEQSAID